MSRIHTLLTGLLSVLLFALPAPSGAAEPPTRWFDAPSEVFRGEPHETLFLRTPTSALGFFVDAAAQGQTDLAALTLDRRVIDATPRPWSDDELVEHLAYLLDYELGIDWTSLSDRPDGVNDQRNGDPKSDHSEEPRRAVPLGSFDLDGREVVVRMHRVAPAGVEPVWMFTPETVAAIPALYATFGPGPVDHFVPDWARAQVLGHTPLWAWGALGALLIGAIVLGLLIRRLVERTISGLDGGWALDVASAAATPAGLLAASAFLYGLSVGLLSLPRVVGTTLLLLLLASITWTFTRVIGSFIEYYARNEMGDIEDLSDAETQEAQRRLTLMSVGRRVLLLVLVGAGLGVIVAQFQSLQVLGVSMLASAGVATVVLGVAAQPVLGNLVASLQIALSRPISIGDSVCYDGQWGWVEDITYTYVLIRLWDERRQVVPLRHLVSTPFENWTIRDAHVMKPVEVQADWRVDVQAVREHVDEVIRSDPDWDERSDPVLEVVVCGDDTVTLRAMCSARQPSAAWDMHCRVREELLAFLREQEDGAWLPRQRVQLREQASR